MNFHCLENLKISVAGSKLELLTAVLSLIFLIKPYTLSSRFYTTKGTSKNNEMVTPADYEMQVT